MIDKLITFNVYLEKQRACLMGGFYRNPNLSTEVSLYTRNKSNKNILYLTSVPNLITLQNYVCHASLIICKEFAF